MKQRLFLFLFIGKLRDATGSYNLPFLITGAILWGAAAILAVVVKCSCWRESKVLGSTPQEPTGSSQQANEHGGVLYDNCPEEEDAV